ncbi:hypothetical protein SAMN05216553_101475 [Lentzea fradiae]|uniref:Uncharacterized protein n=1 Tax=Lentzea fradiae TaxID=200378 RepID=A0A1G7KTL0_9PSEU|nr:hypothetical protein [Lentzea fradiae]SDF40568.1 hypothetical protein SAMN05216553_101475 [Lentzea fradiae]
MRPSAPHDPPQRPALGFAEARVAAEQAEAVQQRQAARRVAEHSRDAGDCLDLLSMLGLSGLSPSGGRAVATAPHPLTFPEALDVFRSTEGARR